MVSHLKAPGPAVHQPREILLVFVAVFASQQFWTRSLLLNGERKSLRELDYFFAHVFKRSNVAAVCERFGE
jgi:hypothetical protein